MPLPTSATSNKLGFVGGASAYPTTFAPSDCSHSESQLPLNPVCPVSRTRLPLQKAGFMTKLSRALCQKATVLQAEPCHAECPLVAKIRGADKPLNFLLGQDAPGARVPK